jgi:hypothetical protein
MSLSKQHRYISITKIHIRNEKSLPSYVPKYSFEECRDIIWKKFISGTTKYEFDDKTKLIRIRDIRLFSDICSRKSFFILLISLGDKNAPDVAYENFETGRTRELQKEVEEGNSLTAHILISDILTELYFPSLIERVSGLNTSIVNRYLNYLLSDEDHKKEYTNNRNQAKKYRPIFEIIGHQSKTIRDTLISGILQDITFVKHESIDEGFDEYRYLKEQEVKVRFKVHEMVENDKAPSLFRKCLDMFREGNYEEFYVRIKTDKGTSSLQEVKTDFDDEHENILDQFYIQNEKIQGFNIPLKQSYDSVEQQIIDKLLDLFYSKFLEDI